MVAIDVCFPVLGNRIAAEHAYPLYSALAGIAPGLHDKEFRFAIAPISGDPAGNGLLALNERSVIRIRLPSDQIALVLPLAGKRLSIAGHSVRIGVPRVYPLVPAAALLARLVTIKGFTEPAPFLEAVRHKLAKLNIAGEPAIPLITTGPRAGQPSRRILRIKDKRIVGFALQVTGLTPQDSITLQHFGIGGRRKMSGGFFCPISPSSKR